MSNSELVAYIQEQTQQGMSAQLLRESLMESGWHEQDIANAFHDVAAGMHPATPGASIHEDLAQVRGMVAHLASRVGTIEAMLPTAFIGPDHELSAAPKHSAFWRVVSIVGVLGLAVWLGVYTTDLVSRYALAPLDQTIIAAAMGLVLILAAIAALMWRRIWLASVLTASAVALWGADTFIAWRTHYFIGDMVAAGLGALILVIIFVIGIWSSRRS